MSSTTEFFDISTTQDLLTQLWINVGCDSSGRKAFTLIWCGLIVLLMALMIYIMYSLIKNKPPSMYITLFYLCVGFIFYIFAILVNLNHCYWHDLRVETIGWIIRQTVYAMGFMILLGMWFFRLRKIFSMTAYPLSRCTVISFVIYLSIGFIDTIMIMIIYSTTRLWFVTDALIMFGFLVMIVGIIWLPGLYIKKLYLVVRSKQTAKQDNKAVKANKFKLSILQNISKNTILTVFTLSGTMISLILLLIMSFAGTFHGQDQFWNRKLTLTVLVIDHSTNILGYVLGYGYCKSVYQFVCGCLDVRVTGHVAKSVAVTLEQETLGAEKKVATGVVAAESTLDTQTQKITIDSTQETTVNDTETQVSSI